MSTLHILAVVPPQISGLRTNSVDASLVLVLLLVATILLGAALAGRFLIRRKDNPRGASVRFQNGNYEFLPAGVCRIVDSSYTETAFRRHRSSTPWVRRVS